MAFSVYFNMKRIVDYLVHELGVDVNTASTLIITLFVFGLGMLLTWVTKTIISQIKRSQYRKCYKLIIKSFVKSCKKQYIHYSEFPNQDGFLEGTHYSFTYITNYSLKYLRSLDVTVFTANFSSFWKCKNGRRISKLLETVESIQNHIDVQKEFVDKLMAKLEKHNLQYESNLDFLRQMHDDIIVKHAGVPLKLINDENKLIAAIHNIYNGWGEGGKKILMRETHKELVMPLLALAKTMQPVPMVRPVIDHAHQCNMAYNNIVNIDRLLKKQIYKSSIAYKMAYKIGEILLKHL